MTICDIFTIISSMIDYNTKEDVNGLYMLSQTNKKMNEIVKTSTNYEVLKKIVKYPTLCEAVCNIINNAIDNNIKNIEILNYIIPYISNKDIYDINGCISVLFMDNWDTCIPRKYRNRCLVEAKMLYDFAKKIDVNFKPSLVISNTDTNNIEYNDMKEVLLDWVNRL